MLQKESVNQTTLMAEGMGLSRAHLDHLLDQQWDVLLQGIRRLTADADTASKTEAPKANHPLLSEAVVAWQTTQMIRWRASPGVIRDCADHDGALVPLPRRAPLPAPKRAVPAFPASGLRVAAWRGW